MKIQTQIKYNGIFQFEKIKENAFEWNNSKNEWNKLKN